MEKIFCWGDIFHSLKLRFGGDAFDFDRGGKKRAPERKRSLSSPGFALRGRCARIEVLEDRQLLSVTPLEYAAIRESFAEFELPALEGGAIPSSVNVIEINADALSMESLYDALDAAAQSTLDDLIVLRTTEAMNTITFASEEDYLCIDWNAEEFGKVSMVGLGDVPLTIDAGGYAWLMGIESGSEVDLGNITLTGCYADEGSAIYNAGVMTVVRCALSGNTSDNGGIYNEGTMSISYCEMSGNLISNEAWVENVGTMTIIGSYLYNNTVVGSSEIGNSGIMNIYHSVLWNNQVDSSTIQNSESGTMTIVNAEISANGLSSSNVVNSGTFQMTNSTVAGNSLFSSFLPGLAVSEESPMSGTIILNSIITMNYDSLMVGENLGEVMPNLGNNFIGEDPRFVVAPLFDEEGNLLNAETIDLHLSAGSWAIDTGNDRYLFDPHDLDGNKRRVGAAVDMGAYEYQGPFGSRDNISTVVTTAEDSFDAADGEWSLREALWFAQDGDVITFAPTLTGAEITLKEKLIVKTGVTISAEALYHEGTREPGLTINAGQAASAFYLKGGSEEKPIHLIGLKITGALGYGVYANAESIFTMTRSVVTGNAGGLFSFSYSALLRECSILGNQSDIRGGGVYNGGVLTLESCLLAGNAALYGGGIYNVGRTLTMIGCGVLENEAEEGGGIDNEYGTLTLTNCTVSGNSASNLAGGIYNDDTVIAYNSIIAQNGAPDEADLYQSDGALMAGRNNLSTFTDWETTTEVTSENNREYDSAQQLFTDAEQGDYTLCAESQALDGGDNLYAVTSAGTPLTADLSGKSRIYNTSVDLGAYEYRYLRLLLSNDTPQEGCSLYCSVDKGAWQGEIRYFWDLSGAETEDVGSFVEREDAFWTSMSELGFDPGDHTIRLKILDANGVFSDTVSATIHVTAVPPMMVGRVSEFADGRVLKLAFDLFSTARRTVEQWTINWGDGSATVIPSLSNALVTAHCYALGDSETIYTVTLHLSGGSGAGDDFIVVQHRVGAANAAPLSAALFTPSGASSDEGAALPNLSPSPLSFSVAPANSRPFSEGKQGMESKKPNVGSITVPSGPAADPTEALPPIFSETIDSRLAASLLSWNTQNDGNARRNSLSPLSLTQTLYEERLRTLSGLGDNAPALPGANESAPSENFAAPPEIGPEIGLALDEIADDALEFVSVEFLSASGPAEGRSVPFDGRTAP